MSPTPDAPLGRDRLADGFDRAARHYDQMVALNPGYRRHLRAAAEALLDRIDDPLPTLLDLGCGSGLSTRELLRAARKRGMTPRIIGVDASAGMLERARAKRWPQGVVFVEGRGEELAQLDLPAADGALPGRRRHLRGPGGRRRVDDAAAVGAAAVDRAGRRRGAPARRARSGPRS